MDFAGKASRQEGFDGADNSTAMHCDQLVGSSPRAQKVYDLIRRVANLPAFVLINGESGTGKELVARAIHNLGSRANRPFVAVSCGAIPENLVEAELFGSEKGAYTGSTGSRAGFLEQAGDGTILLDEIGELSLNTQVKLLRVLQQREFSRLGSNRMIPLKARVLFATHRNLRDMVDAGTFREDFYFRVNVMKIDVPALRERADDIPALSRHILQKYAAEYGKPVYAIEPEAMEALMSHDWPGNVRELENVIQRAIIMANGNSIGLADIPEEYKDEESETGGSFAMTAGEGDSFDELLHEFKVNLVKNAVQESNGNKSLAAKKLRISRAYLHRLIRTEPQLIYAA
jgi:DNA-binding NtrC family response regulator